MSQDILFEFFLLFLAFIAYNHCQKQRCFLIYGLSKNIVTFNRASVLHSEWCVSQNTRKHIIYSLYLKTIKNS